MNTRRLVLYIAILLLLLLLLVAGTSSDLLYYSSTSLSFHMTIEHSIFLGSGALLVAIGGYCLQAIRKEFHARRVLQLLLRFPNILPQQRNAIIIISCLAASALLMVVWHLPLLFTVATLHEDLHLIQHASFVMTGSLTMIAIRMMPTAYVILGLVLMNAAMGLFGALLLVSNHQIFIPYSIEGHVEAGNVMILLSLIMALVAFPAFMINRSLRYELKNQQNMGQ
jgi:cytochrome c oxidase assembly factor CtaG